MSRNLMQCLINSAEKAANIARKIREDEKLLELLIQEKSKDESNPRFVQDFKTLADVLIQEMIKHDVGTVFPELKSNIKGEESPTFTNSLGDSVCVQIGSNPEQTAECLETVLNGDKEAAKILSEEVHNAIIVPENVPEFPEDFDYSKVGIWIDPIDATSEYIAGDSIFSSFPGITSTGLDCVTVLIGAYNTETGLPICGTVNQPFHEKLNEYQYKSKLFWGISIEEIRSNNLVGCDTTVERSTKVGLFSTSEHSNIVDTFKAIKYEIAFAAGAGHKALKVITSEADFYLLSKGSTFKWDTCAPQAILQSLGGGMFDFKKSLEEKDLIPLKYGEDQDKCNLGGVVAIKDLNLARDLLSKLS